MGYFIIRVFFHTVGLVDHSLRLVEKLALPQMNIRDKQ